MELNKIYACSNCGVSLTNRNDWCDLGCGSDYNEMIDIGGRRFIDYSINIKNKCKIKYMKTAIVYRTKAKALKPDIEKDSYGEPDTVQFEICVFSDGKVAQRWLVGKGSMVWWDNIEDLYKIHIYSHPDYGTRVEWNSGIIEEL